MTQSSNSPAENFGVLLGYAPGKVPIYSSNYATVDRSLFHDQQSFRSYIDGIYLGYKWQCVEFARRWLYLNKGYIFQDVGMAYEIFRLRYVRRLSDNTLLPLHSFINGSKRPPEKDCMLIWAEGGEFEHTGHISIVTEVLENSIRIAEQNVDHRKFPATQNWCRELPLDKKSGTFFIETTKLNSMVLGWVIQTTDDTHAVKFQQPNPSLLNINSRLLPDNGKAGTAWLNLNNAAEKAYLNATGGHWLTEKLSEQYRYFRMSEAAEEELIHATNELHLMFLHATEKVLNDENLLAHFNIPSSLWPRLRRSWSKRRGHMITGRFDFCMTEKGLKVYEYNADSASCYLEAGRLQGEWANYFGCHEGKDPGKNLFDYLVDAWRDSGVNSLLHIMQDDDDLEETYHAQFMKAAIEAAGHSCKVIKGVEELSWRKDGEIIDADGEAIRWVWKTWAWETALDQIRHECEEDDTHPPLRTGKQGTGEHSQQKPRLVDVLLRPEVMVFEPFWTLIPSNKAILPILWSLFPNHPYLLNSQFTLTEELQTKGYVTKPIAGRCGHNVSIIDKHENILNETAGKFDHQNQIYQQLMRLPDIDGYRTQMCTFSVGGDYAAACVRADQSLIITTDSDLLPLRIVSDHHL